uniref:Helicase C-terminal domain-containing protein n=1 Tax=Plectus sambesii TaxID=2011161 RepID=A0A914V519_9BILA
DGATKIEQRQVLMERFNADPRIFCFILSTRSGGIGVNLTGADTVIFYDSDWNPTMDAQAQDRCHRIGQTRDVHIYRLISERTIEENILKKATQKRKLGEIAIEEAGFTPDYFKQSGLRDLFDLGADDPAAASAPNQPAPIGNLTRQELEQAMLKLEDTQDAVAAKKASEEARAELAEFDENATIADSELTKTDSQFTELMKQLKPIERYAINFLEAEYKPDFEEEVKETENMIEAQKEGWVKAHERAMQGEMERQEAEEMADFDLTYMTASPCGLDEVRGRGGATRARGGRGGIGRERGGRAAATTASGASAHGRRSSTTTTPTTTAATASRTLPPESPSRISPRIAGKAEPLARLPRS